MAEYLGSLEETKEYAPRYRLLYIAIALTFLTFSTRLWYLQIVQGEELRSFSEKNRIKRSKISAPRGLILDREGKVLVENLPGFEATVSPQYVDDITLMSERVGPILGMDPERIIVKVKRSRKQNGPFASIRLKENLSREEVFRLKRIRLEIPGLEIRESIVRHYPLVQSGAQLLGYVGEISKRQLPLWNVKFAGKWSFEQGDIVGKTGLEEALEGDIRGIDGTSFVQVDAHGRETISATANSNIYGDQFREREPIHGNNAVLTIDRDIQEAAFKAFTDYERIGAMVVMKTNGEILAWISAPSYDPNEFATGISSQSLSKIITNPYKPLRNKVIQDHNSPGSIFKPFVALAALQEKVISPTTIVHAPGVFYFGRRPYHDSIRGGHGYVTVYEALERSSNVFFYKLGIQLGVDRMFNYIWPMGIGQKTGIELPREVSGLMPNSQWKKKERGEEWQGGENLSTAIGQGFVNVTPLQMAVAYNAIATEGKVYKPYLIRNVIDQDGKVLKENFSQLLRDVTQTQSTGVKIDPATFKIVKEGLRRVANGDRGTAKWWKIPGVQMAGKTGTAQVMGFSADQIYTKCDQRPMHMRHHGWYVAYAPYDNPEITVAALTEHSCHGNTGSAPLVRDVIQAYFQKYHPEMIEEGKKKMAEEWRAKRKASADAAAAAAAATLSPSQNDKIEGDE